MENHQLVQLIREELPGILQRDRALRKWVLELTQTQYADKAETESRFDQVLAELRQMREEGERKWEENQRRWEGQERKWEENQRRWEGQERKWEENQQALRQWQEGQERKWEENHQLLLRMQEVNEAQAKKHDSSIGALGARWGLSSEQAFRQGLEGILTASFGVEVINVTEYDDGGEVFGHPDQVELDVIIQDGTLILVEIKSSMSKADMYTFDRKVAFYEQHHGRPVARKLVISPMVAPVAREVAARLGIEVYSHGEAAVPDGP